jgi:hypothetical protein
MLQTKENNCRPAKRTKQKKQVKGIKNAPQANNIKEILLGRGFKSVTPTDQVLQTLDVSMIRFNKILDNKTELTLTEANSFAEWLGVTIEELSPSQPQTLPAKYGLID